MGSYKKYKYKIINFNTFSQVLVQRLLNLFLVRVSHAQNIIDPVIYGLDKFVDRSSILSEIIIKFH